MLLCGIVRAGLVPGATVNSIETIGFFDLADDENTFTGDVSRHWGLTGYTVYTHAK